MDDTDELHGHLVAVVKGCSDPESPELIVTALLAHLAEMSQAQRRRLMEQAKTGYVPGVTGVG